MVRWLVALSVATVLTGCSETNSSNVEESAATDSASVASPRPSDVAPPNTTIDATPTDDHDACEWVTDETVASAINGDATSIEPRNLEDHWTCSWLNAQSSLSVDFVRFQCCFRSVEAEIIRIGGDAAEQLRTIDGMRGAFTRPGVWYGETPLTHYGIATIKLTHADGRDPDTKSFETAVAAVLRDVTETDPEIPS